MPSKLARTLPLNIRGNAINQLKTPLLVPSFSSKAATDIGQVFDVMINSITETFLLSAYDVHHKKSAIPESGPAELFFLDSGGYEALKDHQVGHPYYPSPDPLDWNHDLYIDVLEGIHPDGIMPTIVTSYDHPEERKPTTVQIQAAIDVFKRFPHVGREMLFKPETHDERYIDVNRLIAVIGQFREFDIIGLTEIELGDSIFRRMSNIIRLRSAMDLNQIDKPLHIYGSLDPVCTPLYFLAGADIFDGLSWLRFAYKDDLAVYHSNRAPIEYGIKRSDEIGLAGNYAANLYYLSELTDRMKRYLVEGNEKTLGKHGGFFAQCLVDLRTEHGGAI